MENRPDAIAEKIRPVVKGVAGFLYALLILLLLELLVRVSGTHDADSILSLAEKNVFSATVREGSGQNLWKTKWVEYRPGSSMEVTLPNGDVYAIKINNKGFRTKNFDKKLEGAIRILAIGASTTIQGIGNDKTYPAILEKSLQAEFPDQSIEVLNLGISGTRSDYWLGRMDVLLSFEPDMVIQYNAINDLSQRYYYDQYYQQHYWLSLLRSSDLYQLIFPTNPDEFSDLYAEVIGNLVAMHDALEANSVAYATASFATPSPNSASSNFKGYLDYTTALQWGRWAGYREYQGFYNMIQAYNGALVDGLSQHNIAVVLLHEKITDASDFVDVCHMKQSGIEKQAAAFLPVVSQYIRSRNE